MSLKRSLSQGSSISIPPSSMSLAHESLNSLYVGANLEDVLYGVELFLYFETMRSLLKNRGLRKQSNAFYALFSSVMLFSISVWVITGAISCHKTRLLGPHFPGGPFKYWLSNLSVWYLEWSRISVIILQFMTDALMIYRCRIIWNSNRIIVLPIVTLIATLALGIVIVWFGRVPGSNTQAGITGRISLAYWSISVALNTAMTCLICYRVVRHGRMVRQHLGTEYASLYFTVAAVIVESVLPYTLCSIAFLVSLGVRSPTSVAFIRVYFLMMCMSPQMLILRVTTGNAWDNKTFTRARRSTIRFNPRDDSESHHSDGACGAKIPLQDLSSEYLPAGRGKATSQMQLG